MTIGAGSWAGSLCSLVLHAFKDSSFVSGSAVTLFKSLIFEQGACISSCIDPKN